MAGIVRTVLSRTLQTLCSPLGSLVRNVVAHNALDPSSISASISGGGSASLPQNKRSRHIPAGGDTVFGHAVALPVLSAEAHPRQKRSERVQYESQLPPIKWGCACRRWGLAHSLILSKPWYRKPRIEGRIHNFFGKHFLWIALP